MGVKKLREEKAGLTREDFWICGLFWTQTSPGASFRKISYKDRCLLSSECLIEAEPKWRCYAKE